jgi:glycosyltransferase involved in cell wall biosynthesis
MIVRDEARLLPRCLDSLAGVYDELCAVDTGSRDDTVALLRENGARVVVDTRCNGPDGRIEDFAAARNAALALARGDWVLQIDADEVLEAGAGHIAAVIARARGCVGITMRSQGAQWISGRLFCRADARAYRSSIHEYLEHEGAFSVERGIVICNLPDKQGKESSGERNMRILLHTLQAQPDDARLWHYLGNEHRKAARDEEAITCYERAVALGNYRIGLFHSAYYMGCSHLLLGQYDGAIAAGRRAVEIDPRYAEGHCLVADAHYSKGEWAAARESYMRALACTQPGDALMAVQEWAYYEHPRRQIGRIDVIGAA